MIDDVGQTSFQTTDRFFAALGLRSFPQVVGPALGVLADLYQGHDVQAVVELAIAGPGETVAHDVAGGHLDRCGAGVAGESGRGAESGDGADPAQDFGRGQRADAVQLGEGGTEALTAVAMSAAALAMRRSSWRTSPTRSTARRAGSEQRRRGGEHRAPVRRHDRRSGRARHQREPGW